VFVKYPKTWKAAAVSGSLLVVASVLAGCGGDDNSSSGNTEPTSTGSGPVEEPDHPVTITFESWVNESDGMKKLYAAFHKEYPNITVKFINASADGEADKLTTQIAGGTAPDTAFVDASNTSDFASRGAVVNLDSYIDRSDVINLDDYVPAFRTFVTYNNSTWGLPFDGESTGLFYRKDRFQEAGIDHPPTTWDEFQADAEALTDTANNQYGFEIFAPEAAYYWYPWLYQAGGDLLSEDGQSIVFNSDEGKQAAEFYVNLAKYSPPDYYNSNSYDGRVAFENGNVAMYVAGSWLAGTIHAEKPGIDDLWTTAPLPDGAAGCKTTIAGDALVMFTQSKEQDASWLWLQFLSRPENLAQWTWKDPNSTELPPLQSQLDSPELAKTKPVLKGFAELMKCGVASTVAQPKFPRIETILNDELGKAIYGDQTASEAVDNAAQQGEEILAH